VAVLLAPLTPVPPEPIALITIGAVATAGLNRGDA
jgi:hypothetical protein